MYSVNKILHLIFIRLNISQNLYLHLHRMSYKILYLEINMYFLNKIINYCKLLTRNVVILKRISGVIIWLFSEVRLLAIVRVSIKDVNISEVFKTRRGQKGAVIDF